MIKKILLTAILTFVPISQSLAQSDEEAAQREALAEAQQSLQEAAARVAELSSDLSPARSQVFNFLKDSKRAMLGVSIASSSEDEKAGANVQAVSPGGPAEKAGLETGDKLLSINGQLLGGDGNAASEVLEILSELMPGDEVVIEYERDNVIADTVVVAERRTPALLAPIAPLTSLSHGKIIINTDDSQIPKQFSINASDFPDSNTNAAVFLIAESRFYSGLELVNLNNTDLANYFNNENGLLVVDVPEDFPIDLRGGDVLQSIDGRSVETSRQAFKVLDTYETDETLTFNILRGSDYLDLQMIVPEKVALEQLSNIESINIMNDGEELLINGLHLDFEENHVVVEDNGADVKTVIVEGNGVDL